MANLGNVKTCEGFECTDGRKFTNKNGALIHQQRIDVINIIKGTDFKLSFDSEADDLQIGDLSLILEMANVVKGYEKFLD